MFPLGQHLLSLSLLGISTYCWTANDCFGSGKPLKWVSLPPKAVWAGDNSLNIFCDKNYMFCCTTLSYTCVWGQSSWSGQSQRCFSFGTGWAGPSPPCLQRDRSLPHEHPAQQNSLGKGNLGKDSHIWGRTEMLMKLLCWGSKECLGKTRRIEPVSTKCKHREVISEESWEHVVAAGGLWRQLRKGQWQFPCSSLFFHLHRDKSEAKV